MVSIFVNLAVEMRAQSKGPPRGVNAPQRAQKPQKLWGASNASDVPVFQTKKHLIFLKQKFSMKIVFCPDLPNFDIFNETLKPGCQAHIS